MEVVTFEVRSSVEEEEEEGKRLGRLKTQSICYRGRGRGRERRTGKLFYHMVLVLKDYL